MCVCVSACVCVSVCVHVYILIHHYCYLDLMLYLVGISDGVAIILLQAELHQALSRVFKEMTVNNLSHCV